ncbi:hypothetical protein AB0M87_07455 [Streptomyces sp. NPDC051320]|uniref:hypothetical protein n=1 Tax=Streptomyces sp. NPDC051320 TaxID=3154644 RepID=UPI00344A0BF3
MNRRSLPVAAALATAAALLLTACGGGGDSKSTDSDKIAGADTGASKPASPSPSASASAGVDRPTIHLPSDIKNTFDWPKTGSAAKDSVLSDTKEFIKSRDMAIANQDPLDKAYRFYTEGEMAASTQEYISDYVKHNARTTGAYRYYRDVVTMSGADTATLSYCQDQGKGYDMDIKSKKINKTQVTKNSYVLYNAALRKNDKGVWVTTKLYSQRGSAKCQP